MLLSFIHLLMKRAGDHILATDSYGNVLQIQMANPFQNHLLISGWSALKQEDTHFNFCKKKTMTEMFVAASEGESAEKGLLLQPDPLKGMWKWDLGTDFASARSSVNRDVDTAPGALWQSVLNRFAELCMVLKIAVFLILFLSNQVDIQLHLDR